MEQATGMTSYYSVAQALIGKANRDTFVSLSLVVKPAFACSLPFLCVWGEKWSRRRESNPHEKLGKLSFYH